MNYKSQQHKTIFEKAVKKKDKSNRVLIAAMYLLTADNKLWQIMQRHIEQNRIDFDGVKLNVITENAYTLYCAAKDMYFNTDFLSISDIADTSLISPKIFEVIGGGRKIYIDEQINQNKNLGE